MNVTASTNIQQVKIEDATRFIDIALQDIVSVINGRLDFTNFNAKIVEVDFTVQNTDVPIVHGLGRVPDSYFVISQTAATSIVLGDESADSTTFFLKSTQLSTVRMVVF